MLELNKASREVSHISLWGKVMLLKMTWMNVIVF